jgi:DNA processing protein
MNWFAMSQGREVFALPGKVDSHTSFGTNGLIKQGAKLVSDVEDILEEFGLNRGFMPSVASSTPKEDNAIRELSDAEAIIYNTLSKEPVLLDEIAEKANLSIPGISDILLRLQLKKMIRQLPGKQFVRI